MRVTSSKFSALATAVIALSIFSAGSAAAAAPSVESATVRAETTNAPPQFVRGSFVKFVNNTPETVFVREANGGRHDGQGGEPKMLQPGEGIHLSGNNEVEDWNTADVRIRIYESVKDLEQRDHPGRMLQVVSATNFAFDHPRVCVHKDPYVQQNDKKTYNKIYQKNFSVKESYDFRQGGCWTHAHREVDSPDHKVFVVKIHELPTETIEDRAYDTTSPIDVL